MAEMAKTNLKVAPAVETLKPYLDRALNDKDFRDDLKEAMSAAQKLYGPLAKNVKRRRCREVRFAPRDGREGAGEPPQGARGFR